MTPSIGMARSDERRCIALSLLVPIVCGSKCLGTRKITLLVRMIVSSQFPQFRHRIA
jgi:hypothetical protein